MKLNEEQIESLKDVVGYILEFERHDYEDWCVREGSPKDHVYHHANLLKESIEKWSALDAQEIERHCGLVIGEDGTVKEIL